MSRKVFIGLLLGQIIHNTCDIQTVECALLLIVVILNVGSLYRDFSIDQGQNFGKESLTGENKIYR